MERKYGYRVLYTIAWVFFGILVFAETEGLLAIRIGLSLIAFAGAVIYLDASGYLPFKLNKRFNPGVGFDSLGFIVMIALFVKAIC